jgi:predicted lipoprotein with Yx(FWY)xxD motif
VPEPTRRAKTMGLRPFKTRVIVAAAAAALGAGAGLAGAAAAVTMKTAVNSSLGATIVVSATGRTLYHDAAEPKNKVKCLGSCAKEWPPLIVTAGGKPVAGAGVTAAKLGVLKRPDGKLQVTYAGLPLYLYAGDSKAGDVNGQGVGGIWHAIAPSGSVITKAAKTTSGSSGASSGSKTGSSGSSGGSSGGGSGSGSGGSGSGGGSTTPSSCDVDPGGYGCM